MTTALTLWMMLVCAIYGVPYELADRVAQVESGNKHYRYRLGRLGKSKFFGPMGIHEDFLVKWPVNEPSMNILVGVRALAMHKKATGSWNGALRKYHGEPCPDHYLKNILR